MTSKDITDSVDKAFLGTALSLGYTNAKKAIKYVLFDDTKSVENNQLNKNKWLFISNSQKGRDLTKKLHHIDLMQMLINFCYCYIGLENKPFTITKTKYKELKSDMFVTMTLTNEELIEYVIQASMISIEEAYILLSTNKELQLNILNSLIKQRYKNKLSKDLDNFKEIKFPKMKIKQYETFIEKFNNLDLEFALLKRKTPNYGA